MARSDALENLQKAQLAWLHLQALLAASLQLVLVCGPFAAVLLDEQHSVALEKEARIDPIHIGCLGAKAFASSSRKPE